MRAKKLLFIFFGFTLYQGGISQNIWNTNAEAFITKYAKLNLTGLSLNKIDTLIVETTGFITPANDSADQTTLSELYGIRGGLQLEKLQRKFYDKTPVSPSDNLAQKIEEDYQKAISLCSTCKCKHLEWLKVLYMYEDEFKKSDEIDRQITSLGGSGEWKSYLGLTVNYIAPANVIGAELCAITAGRLFPKKFKDPQSGKKYWACTYVYPMALGLFSAGYERSLDNSNYNAFKIDPIWLDAYISLHPAQFLYAANKDTRSFIWRPEIGFSFSTLNVNYGYNLPFKKSFSAVPNHLISLRITIPFFKI